MAKRQTPHPSSLKETPDLSASNLLRLCTIARRMSSSNSNWNYETLVVSSPAEFVAHVELNRPDKGNAMNNTMWGEMRTCFDELSDNPDVRVVVLSGRGRILTGGLDLAALTATPEFFDTSIEVGRRARRLSATIANYQQSFTSIEQCKKPVIAAIHNACIGGGVDMVTACDIRLCTEDSYFCVKEVDLGLAADVGTLQRLPKVVGNDSWAREVCYTARRVSSGEALNVGLVSRILADRDSAISAALTTAKLIAAKSPIAVQTTKEALVYARDHDITDSLNQMRLLNQCMLQSEDLVKSAEAMIKKETPVFSKL